MSNTDYSAQETITRGLEMYGQDALAIWLTVVGPVLSSVTDEVGGVQTFTVLAQYDMQRYQAPAYRVLCTLGRHMPEPSMGVRGTDPGNPGNFLFARVYLGTTVQVRIEAQSEAQREWMIDLLLAGYELSMAADSAGNLIPYPVGEMLYSKGFVYKGTDAPVNLPPLVSADDPTPEGRIFPATITFHYDLTVSISQPGIIVNGAAASLKTTALGEPWPIMPVGSPPSPGWGPFPVGAATTSPGWVPISYGTPGSPGYTPVPVAAPDAPIYAQPPLIGPVITVKS